MHHSDAVLLTELHACMLCKAAKILHMQSVPNIIDSLDSMVNTKPNSSPAFRTRGSSQLNIRSSGWGPRAGSAVSCTWICQCCWKT